MKESDMAFLMTKHDLEVIRECADKINRPVVSYSEDIQDMQKAVIESQQLYAREILHILQKFAYGLAFGEEPKP